MKFPLTHPIEVGETIIQSVTLRRAKAKDMVRIADHMPALARLAPGEDGQVDATQFDGAVVAAMIQLVSTLGDLAIEVAEELDFSDLVELASKAADFLSGPAGSPTPGAS